MMDSTVAATRMRRARHIETIRREGFLSDERSRKGGAISSIVRPPGITTVLNTVSGPLNFLSD